jgi:N-ethylmaleimide reductase
MADGALSLVLQPVTVGDFHLKNRVVMASLTRSRSSNEGVPPPFAADYYAQRAGAGLIVTEATNISPQARGYAFTPGIWSVEQVAAWRRIVDAVQQGRVFGQVSSRGNGISWGGIIAPTETKISKILSYNRFAFTLVAALHCN